MKKKNISKKKNKKTGENGNVKHKILTETNVFNIKISDQIFLIKFSRQVSSILTTIVI